ncbi:hypothetical protein DID76_00285 [Candidatus Marinamargulisbacteria bacterium SCGC AG-414-C22]|nr:hypothetical protein DID76_00285 [Candidatus Marinamargulisbacteria bacterium SCGC AG-414-C22]
MDEQLCYCNSKQLYSICCKPFITHQKKPETALKLMRSRYTAFCLKDASYIKSTMKGRALQFYDEDSICNSPIKWLGLTIVDSEDGQDGDDQGTVTFQALFKNHDDDPEVSFIEEKSVFKYSDNQWFYVDLVPNS